MLDVNRHARGGRCALCHNEQEDGDWGKVSLQRSLMLTPDAATNHGLGPLLLVKVSAIANAWVHSQCAVWSPEVCTSHQISAAYVEPLLQSVSSR